MALLFTPLYANAIPVLFGIQADGAVAELLPYGPTPITTASSPFLSTLNANTLSSVWYSQGVDGLGNVLYDIQWNFTSGAKTLAQRFVDAVAVGEAVNWTVTSPSSGVQNYSGVWRFSDSAGITAATFLGSGSNFSADDGIWGAGNGVLNANGTSSPGNIAWGFGNIDGNDFFSGGQFSAALVLDGVDQTTLPSGFRNLMFFEDGLSASAPELNSSASSLPLLFVGSLLLACAPLRRKSAQTV